MRLRVSQNMLAYFMTEYEHVGHEVSKQFVLPHLMRHLLSPPASCRWKSASAFHVRKKTLRLSLHRTLTWPFRNVRFAVRHSPPLSSKHATPAVMPDTDPGGQHLALLYDTWCFSTLVELSSLGKCLVRMATKVAPPLTQAKKATRIGNA